MLRLPLRLIPSDFPMPILQGRLRGLRWIVAAGNHGCWLGSYEYAKRKLFERVVAPGDVVFDIGAQAGFYTLLASVLVGSDGWVVAFEPAKRNLGYLQAHLRINAIRNVTVLDAAVSHASGVATFMNGADSFTGRIDPSGSTHVRTVSLDDLLLEGSVPSPDVLKIDVEGGELQVLMGAERILATARPVIFLETHGPDPDASCRKLLLDRGYAFRSVDGSSSRHVLVFPVEKRSEFAA